MKYNTLSIIGDNLLYTNIEKVISLAKRSDVLWIGGDNTNNLIENNWNIDKIKPYCNHIFFQEDGFGCLSPQMQDDDPIYIPNIKCKSPAIKLYDVGPKSLVILATLIKNSENVIVKGSVENIQKENYTYGSSLLSSLLKIQK